jgi:trk system potassium uptake protein TrkA
LARRLARPSIIDQIDLGDASLAEVDAPETFVGETLRSLDVRNRYDVLVLAIRRGSSVITNPGGDQEFETGDVLVLIGREDAVSDIASLA